MKNKNQRLEQIDVVRRENGKIHVLGRNGSRFYHIIHNAETDEIVEGGDGFESKGYPSTSELFTGFFAGAGLGVSLCLGLDSSSFGGALAPIGGVVAGFFSPSLNYLLPSVREGVRRMDEYFKDIDQFTEANMADLREAVKSIRVYQGSVADLSNELGRPIERVDTGKPETFICGADNFWLRVEAHCLGADAIVNYQPGSSIGTPVKYSSKK